MKRLRRQRNFLESVLKEANRNKRGELLFHANADQINAVSELVLNLLKNKIPLPPSAMVRLKRHKNALREMGKRRNSLKKRRKVLLSQNGSEFWKGLGQVYRTCLCKKRG